MTRIMGWLLAVTVVMTAGMVEVAADEVPLSAVPPAVRTAIEREVGDGRLKEIERESENGRVVYEVEFVRDNREQEVKIAEDGTVLQRERDGGSRGTRQR